ncbi:MAG: PGPGW domain-containing protein [Bacteroidota bacterium]|nr:PGPGW domain-containing protein [Bacteroidota bacterium]MDP4231160.1 PGPGW domain-containing protein [Bacteroidota bacterium]
MSFNTKSKKSLFENDIFRHKVINLTLGWTFILLGLVGSLLPVLQGFLFFFVGLLFLSKEYHWAFRLVEWLRVRIRKYSPKAGRFLERSEVYLEGEVHKIATEKHYLRKRVITLIALILLLAAIAWALTLFVRWVVELF